jgi:hypothetical protein
VSVCNPFAYFPWSPCYVSGPGEETRAAAELAEYVRLASEAPVD